MAEKPSSVARVIKKYSNRRMYDTEASQYINLDGVAELVREGHDIQVVDAKSGQDLTRSVLTQIIVEESRDGEGGPPLDFLRDLVKSTDDARKEFLHWYLSSAADAYKKMQDVVRDAVPQQPEWPSLGAQREAWSKMWDPFGAAKSWMESTQSSEPQRNATPSDDTEEVEKPATGDELAELRRRLEELESRLGR